MLSLLFIVHPISSPGRVTIINTQLNCPSIQIATVRYKSLENPYYIVPAKDHLIGVTCGLLGFIFINFDKRNFEPHELSADAYRAKIEAEMISEQHGTQTGYTFTDIMWFVGNETDYNKVSGLYKE